MCESKNNKILCKLVKIVQDEIYKKKFHFMGVKIDEK